MKNLLLTKLFILLLAESLTASYLTVSDPRQTWKYGQGKIEESTISLLPKGIYTEVSMYLTFRLILLLTIHKTILLRLITILICQKAVL